MAAETIGMPLKQSQSRREHRPAIPAFFPIRQVSPQNPLPLTPSQKSLRNKAIVPGNKARILKYNAIVFGYNAKVAGNIAIVAGYREIIAGYRAIVAGYRRIIAGYRRIIAGYRAIVAGYRRIIAGNRAIVARYNSIIAGYNSNIAGYNSIVAGVARRGVCKKEFPPAQIGHSREGGNLRSIVGTIVFVLYEEKYTHSSPFSIGDSRLRGNDPHGLAEIPFYTASACLSESNLHELLFAHPLNDENNAIVLEYNAIVLGYNAIIPENICIVLGAKAALSGKKNFVFGGSF
ncbi:MAG: hypothetical protein LBD21_05300 [Tannerellaceae bacterium]|jgi:hypothetical protein|nr:hypothetical protein [Tannerellaceae bacterium]